MIKHKSYEMTIYYMGLFGGKDVFNIISHAILESGSLELITDKEIFLLIPMTSIKKIVFDSIFTEVVKDKSSGFRQPPQEKV